METFGRTKITTNYRTIDDNNILEVLQTAFIIHQKNSGEIIYLHDYYRGNQTILTREKKIRPTHNAKIVENHAFEIANFIAGYLLAKPIQYVAKDKELDIKQLAKFNSFIDDTNKESQDMQIAKDRSIGGVGYRLVLPNNGDQPLECTRLDPQQTFVVYSSTIGNMPLIGATHYKEKIGGIDCVIIEAYTKDRYYKINYTASTIIDSKSHTIGYIPIIEYPLNEERLGSFEVVLTMLDAINLIDSDQVNAITQFVQAFMVFKNIKVSKELIENLKEMGAIEVADNGEVEAKIEYITQELNQTQVNSVKDMMIQTVYKIVGMPQQNSSGDGNGLGVIYRDGWTEVEAKMRPNELAFKESERLFLKIALSITKTLTLGKINIKANQIEIKFTRSNYENISQKVDAFSKIMSHTPEGTKVAPILAYQVSGIVSDPEQACLVSEKYTKEHQPNVKND